MIKINFGTDGWRAIIAQDYTVENVARVSKATADWINANAKNKSVVIGYDCRFGGQLFSETAAKVFCANGVKVFLSKNFSSTPMVSLGCVQLNAGMGVVITASHNPPSYNGFKLKGNHGGPSSPAIVKEVEDMIPDSVVEVKGSLEEYAANGLIEYVDLEANYIEHLKKNFDLKAINESEIHLAYDAMYGAGQNVIRQIISSPLLLHCDYNPSFKGTPPEPLDRNLQELAMTIKSANGKLTGLATDGDADRIGMYDEDGNFVDAHHIILLLIHYLSQYKKMTGKVVIAFSVSEKVRKLCAKYNFPVEVTKIGFKYISDKMVNEDVLVGGEESGGIAVKGHIPERDGIWDGLVLLEFMAKTGKTMKQIIQEVYDVVGAFYFDRLDLHLKESLKQQIIKNCSEKKYSAFGKYKPLRTEDIDGFKYHLSENEWFMIRPSGTEPLLRVYAEAPTKQGVAEILETVKNVLLN